MGFSVQQLEDMWNAALVFHMDRGDVHQQSIYNKPLLKWVLGNQKTFPGGRQLLTVRVAGQYPSGIVQGVTADDPVSYIDPTGIKTASFPWKILHWGMKITMEELLVDGISISNTTTGQGETEHSQRDMTVLANLFATKLVFLQQGSDEDLNNMFWGDGTADPALVPGIRSFVVDNPAAAAAVAGIDPIANPWWQNRANLAIDIGAAAPEDQKLMQFLQNEWRQLTLYGGNPNLCLAGSDFLDALEKQLRAKGYYTDSGWASQKMDGAVRGVKFQGVDIQYDPTLDKQGLSKRMYALDTRHIRPMVIQGEDRRKHFPARPYDRYVYFRGFTWSGGLACDQRNCHGVYGFA